MGYLFCYGTCCVCHVLFSFNPDLVPSVVTARGKLPICRACVEWANPKRAEKNLPPIVVLPGAYDPQQA